MHSLFYSFFCSTKLEHLPRTSQPLGALNDTFLIPNRWRKETAKGKELQRGGSVFRHHLDMESCTKCPATSDLRAAGDVNRVGHFLVTSANLFGRGRPAKPAQVAAWEQNDVYLLVDSIGCLTHPKNRRAFDFIFAEATRFRLKLLTPYPVNIAPYHA